MIMILFHWVSDKNDKSNIKLNFCNTVLESDRTTMVTGNLEVHYIPEKAVNEPSAKTPNEVNFVKYEHMYNV